MPEPVLFCWSGGKDSALALAAMRERSDCRVSALLTTITEGYDRVSMHGVRRELLERQAETIGLPLEKVFIPPECVNPVYEARMQQALEEQYARGVRRVVFGDIFLADLRAWRENNLARIGMTGEFPLWNRDTRELAHQFVRSGFRAVTVCVDSRILDPGFAGRELDDSFFADLPTGVDPCGENGEFHTFVFDGPGFAAPVGFRRGDTVLRDSFYFCDLIPSPGREGEQS